MIWILGVDYQIVKYICEVMEDEGKKVFISAINSENNISVSGLKSDLQELAGYMEEEGGVIIPLDVGGPFHCKLMEKAANDFNIYLNDRCHIKEPNKTILFNSSGKECNDCNSIKQNLSNHICNKILWNDIMSNCLDGEHRIIEIATNNIFNFILKDYSVDYTCISINSIEDLNTVI